MEALVMGNLVTVKLVSLLFALFFTLLIVLKAKYKEDISYFHIIMWAIAVTGFIVIQFELYK
jgi:hypothetical protein